MSIHYRLTPVQRAIPSLGAWLGLLVFAGVFWLGRDAHATFREVVGFVLLPVFVTALSVIFGRHDVVTLTDTGVIARGALSRSLRWSDIRAIQVERNLGMRVVVVYDFNGRQIQLRAPISTFDPGFDAKCREMVDTWQRHRMEVGTQQ